MFEVERDLWGHLVQPPTRLPRTGCPGLCQDGFEHLHKPRFCTQKRPLIISNTFHLKQIKMIQTRISESNQIQHEDVSECVEKSPDIYIFPQYSLSFFFFVKLPTDRRIKIIQISPTPKRISFDFVLSIKIYAWKSGSQNIPFVY